MTTPPKPTLVVRVQRTWHDISPKVIAALITGGAVTALYAALHGYGFTGLDPVEDILKFLACGAGYFARSGSVLATPVATPDADGMTGADQDPEVGPGAYQPLSLDDISETTEGNGA